MRVITEIELRELYKKQPFDSYVIESPNRLTPSAHQFLSERRIKILDANGQINLDDRNNNSRINEKAPAQEDMKPTVTTKPEECTHLRGKLLVYKNHRRIKFRGKLDSTQADVIEMVTEIQNTEPSAVVEDLMTILAYLRNMMRAEVVEEPLGMINFNGWNEQDIRERSHHPDKYFGVHHFTPDPSQGRLMAKLNRLRTQIRELEIVAVDAFLDEKEDHIERQDIVTALNRLSSLVYIMMCQYLSGFYKTQR